MQPDEEQYSLASVLIHWSMAILIVAMFGIALYMTSLPKGEARSWWYSLHKSTGMTIGLLVWVRLYRYLRGPLPRTPPARTKRLALAACWTHRILYLLLIAAPVAGYLTSAYTPNPVKFWGFPLPPLLAPDKGLNEMWKHFHNFACYSLLALVVVHTTGGLYHRLKGSTRMFSWTRQELADVRTP